MLDDKNHDKSEDDGGEDPTKTILALEDAGGGASVAGRPLQFGQFRKVSAGRRPDSCWAFLYEDEREQHREIATYCKLCRVIVRLHGKVDKVKSYLRGCKPFMKLLDTMVSSDIPKWMPKQGQQ